MVEYVLNAESRSVQGKGASRRLRRANKVPAIMYGAGKDPSMLTLDQNELTRKLEHESFYSHILTIKIGSVEERAVLKDMHRHPYKPIIQHVDLLRVSETEELRMHVPLHFINEDVAPGVKTEGGIVSHQMIEVEISCLPKDLPEYIEVDVGNLHVGEAIHLSELKVPAGVEIVELSHGAEHDQSVVSIHMPRVVVEEEAKPAEAAPAEGAASAKPEGES